MDAIKERAIKRVGEIDDLNLHSDMILDDGWDYEDGHWEWVATAPVVEIVQWAEYIEASEEAAALSGEEL